MMESTAPLLLTEWLGLLRCPGCRGLLSSQSDAVRCTDCRQDYPILDGVVRFLRLRDDDEEDRIKRREVEARDAAATKSQAKSAERIDRIEIPPCLAAMAPSPNDVVAELGCGVGRLTLKFLPSVQRVVAIDFSLNSLQVLRERIPPAERGRVLLVQADITSPPLAAAAFSKVVSFQVIEHVPSAEARRRALREARELLSPGGSFVFTVYNWSLSKRRDAAREIGDYTRKEGYHDSGIYYCNFEREELLRTMREAGLDAGLLRGLIIALRGGSALGPLAVPMNRLLSGTRFGLDRAHLLLVSARAASSRPGTPRTLGSVTH